MPTSVVEHMLSERASSFLLGCDTGSCHAADYDLTGQIMWPAAQLLAEYLAAHTSVMTACSCALELGSGLGLPGILCAKVDLSIFQVLWHICSVYAL